jgi:SAM-dependent methyltransferase
MLLVREASGADSGGTSDAADCFASYLNHRAAFAAMLRGAEGALMRQAGPFAAPALDLGCGDGFFASQVTPTPQFVGLDPDVPSLRLARQRGSHTALTAASACRLPFRTASFATVMSNSVLEHIPDLTAALHEIRRVLQPGGRLAITVPSHRFADLLGASSALRAIGWTRAAQWYGNWFNGHSRHYHTLDAAAWTARLSGCGFEVDTCHYYFSPAAMRAFDLAHYLSVPRLVSRKLTGKWVISPRWSLNGCYSRWWSRHADPRPRKDGAYLFLAAHAGGPVG